MRPPCGSTDKKSVNSYRDKIRIKSELTNWPAPIYDRPLTKPAYSSWPVECLFKRLR